jgi:CheY-like chemotaxis protein
MAHQKGPLRPIMLVEDDPHHAELITEALRAGGLENTILSVQTGREALEHFFQSASYSQPRLHRLAECPCLVILDLRLPDIEGYEVLKRLKQDRIFELIPVVIVTTSADEQDVKRCYDLQANGYITKPVDFQEFFDKVRQTGVYWVTVNESVPV